MSWLARLAAPFAGARRALASRPYRIYWIGQFPHVQGIWLHRVAAGWLIFDMTGSPAWLGAIGFAIAAPSLILSPIAGAVCDRIGHRRTSMLATASGMCVIFCTTMLATLHLMTPILLFSLVTLLAICVAFEFPSRQALVPSLLPREAFTEGMALNWAVFNVAFFTGPLLAGVLLTLGGPQLAFASAVCTYAWMTVALFRIPTNEPPLRGIHFGGLLRDIATGVTYTLHHPVIPWIIGLQVAASLLVRPYIDLMPGFAVQVFGRDEQGLASLLAASGVGALVFSILLTMYSRERWLVYTFAAGMIGSAIMLVLFTTTNQFWIGLVCLFFVGGLATTTGISNATLLQQYVDTSYRGRVVSLNMAFQVGTPALGSLTLGWIAEYVGLQIAVGTGAAIVVALTAINIRHLFRKRREIPPAL
jgi:MFS family permease